MSPARSQGPTSFDLLLYAATVFGWGTSWYAMKVQVGLLAPELAVIWRFVLGASGMFLWAALAGMPLRFPLRLHARFALLGLFLFSTNFVFFYYGARLLPSGLLSVVFSLSAIGNLLFAALLLGLRIEWLVAAGALLGSSGIALIFLPALLSADTGPTTLLGLIFCIAGTTSFCLGNIVSADLQRRGVPVIVGTAWSMAYGIVLLVLFVTARGIPFAFDWSVPYVVSLLWLAGPSTVLAFATYLTLLGRIGPGRAGYVTVLFPIVALAVSTVLESYVWTLSAVAGVGLVMAGNVLVLRTRRQS